MIANAPGPLPQSASQLRLAEARANDAAVLRWLTLAGDAGLRSADLADRTELPRRTVQAVVQRLVTRGLAARDGQRGAVRATVAGRSQAGAGVPGAALGAALEAAIDYFPTEAQRAFLRLLLSGIVARVHMASTYPDGWGGFIVTGPTKTAKTSLARFACRVFGIDERLAIRVLRDETPGSIFARRHQGQGGAWEARPSSLLQLPFLCLDEYDKAPEEGRREAARLLQGQVAVNVEGTDFAISPVPLVVLNARPRELSGRLHEAYVRRSPVLDTGELGGLLREIDEEMRKLFARGVIPHLNLKTLRPLSELPEAVRRALRDALTSGLTEEGWRLADVEAISRLALGRTPLMGPDADPGAACVATALDYLIVTSTVAGHVRDGAVIELGAKLGGTQPLAPNIEAHRSDQVARARRDREADTARVAEDLAFEADRAGLRDELLGAVDRLGRRRDPEASRAKAALRKAATKVQECRSREALEVVRAAAQLHRELAETILRARAADEQREAQAKADAAARREQDAWARKQAALRHREEQRRAREGRAAAAKSRSQWTRTVRALHSITPYDSLRVALDRLTELGWLERGWREAPPGSGWLDRWVLSGSCWLVKLPGVPGWPVRTVVDERVAGDFWRVACELAEAKADRSRIGLRPAWQSKDDIRRAREQAQLRREFGW